MCGLIVVNSHANLSSRAWQPYEQRFEMPMIMLCRSRFAPPWLREMMVVFEGRYSNTVLLAGISGSQVEIILSLCFRTEVRSNQQDQQERSSCK